MITVEIRHRTTDRYHEDVRLGPHRLMLRPRESPDVRIDARHLDIRPAADLNASEDVYGNTAVTATFAAATDTLAIESVLRVALAARRAPVVRVAAGAFHYPFAYDSADRLDLAAFLAPDQADDDDRLDYWARSFVVARRTDTLSLLNDVAAGIAGLRYEARRDGRCRSPTETLACGAGSCRDFAVLFVDTARRLGFGARVVTGYLFQPELAWAGSNAAGSLHAWADVYIPGAGWVAVDPTNRNVGGANLVPLAVARSIARVAPIRGSFAGRADAFAGRASSVGVRAVSPDLPAGEIGAEP